MQVNTHSSNIQIIDLDCLHDMLLPEELDIDRGFNSQTIEKNKEN
jgi:hypothetical protein